MVVRRTGRGGACQAGSDWTEVLQGLCLVRGCVQAREILHDVITKAYGDRDSRFEPCGKVAPQ